MKTDFLKIAEKFDDGVHNLVGARPIAAIGRTIKKVDMEMRDLVEPSLIRTIGNVIGEVDDWVGDKLPMSSQQREELPEESQLLGKIERANYYVTASSIPILMGAFLALPLHGPELMKGCVNASLETLVGGSLVGMLVEVLKRRLEKKHAEI